MGEYTEAEDLLLEALATLQQVQAEDSPLESPALVALAGVYEETQRLQEARDTYRQAIDVERRLSGEDHPAVANILSNLAGLVAKSDAVDEAEELYREALRIYEAKPDFVGPQRPVLFKRLGELVCGLTGRGDEGVALFRSAQTSVRAALGVDHWIVGEVDSAYGACLGQLGNRAAAEPLLRQGLKQIRELLGEEHPQTEKAKSRLQQFEATSAEDSL